MATLSEGDKTDETSSRTSNMSDDSLVMSSHEQDSCSNTKSEHSSTELECHIEGMPNRLEIKRLDTLNQCINKAALMLRVHSKIEIRGVGVNIPTCVTLVETLKKRGLAVVDSIRTGMNITEHMICSGNTARNRPSAMMTFSVSAGELAEYVSGFRQDKIIQIFEKYDNNVSGHLSVDVIKSLDFGQQFCSSAKAQRKADTYLQVFEQKNEKLDLPNFIEYASLLVHPLLKEEVFKGAIAEIELIVYNAQ